MLSFIIPVYKTPAQLLRNCLDSVLRYSQPMELICVLDSPGDVCEQVLDEYAENDSRVHVFKNDCNRGVSYSRNRGESAAQSEYIAFVDADDEIIASAYERALFFVEKDNLAACVLTANGTLERRFGVEYGCEIASNIKDMARGGVIAASYCWAVYPIVIRRCVWEKQVGGFVVGQRFGEDFMAVTKLLCYDGKFGFLNVKGYVSVGHSASACRSASGVDPFLHGMRAVLSVMVAITGGGATRDAVLWYLANTIPLAFFDRHSRAVVKGVDRDEYERLLRSFATIMIEDCTEFLSVFARMVFALIKWSPSLWFVKGMPLSLGLHVLHHFGMMLK